MEGILEPNELIIECLEVEGDVWVAHLNNIEVASTREVEVKRLTKIAAHTLSLSPPSVALIGGGFGILSKLLPSTIDMDVYELYPQLAPYNINHNVILGDFHTTLPASNKLYHVILNDTDAHYDFSPYLLQSGVYVDGNNSL